MKTPTPWSSRISSILSAVGSAIGLGTTWKFPCTVGINGGAVFFLLFLLFTILIALPVQLAELYIGRKSGENAMDVFKMLAPDTLWPWVGRMGVFACLVLLSFYSVVGGWVLNYVVHAFDGSIRVDANSEALPGNTIASPVGSMAYQGLLMLMTVWVVKSRISSGIEKTNRYMMPALFILLLLLAGRPLALPNTMVGVSLLLKPDWSYLSPQTTLAALGQTFFALSIGISTTITYAAYLDRKQDLFRSGHSIMWINPLASLLAGLVIFPVVSAFGFEPSQGLGLIFMVLPTVFMKLPLGNLLFAVFILLVVSATFTSAFSMLETVTAAAIRENENKRSSRTWIIGTAIFIVGIPFTLSFGVLSEMKLFGKALFDLWDYMITALIMPIGALSVAVFVGWIQKKQAVLEHMHEDSGVPQTVLLLRLYTLRFLAPVAIVLVFANTLGWI